MLHRLRSFALSTPLGSLSRRGRDAARGFGWMGAGQGLGVVVRLGSNLLLTRLLVPEAFALIGTALAVLAMLEWLSDLGLQPAVIRHPQGESSRVTSTAWWLGMIRGLLLTTIALIAAEPLADFYGEPQLMTVLAIMASRPLLISLRSAGYPLLRRRMEYRKLFIEEVVQLVGSAVVTIGCAIVWRSPIAIATGIAAGGVFSALLSYVLVPANLGRFDRDTAAELLRFSGPVFLNTLAMALWLNLDRLLGLKLLQADLVGIYMVAFNLAASAEALVVRGCDVYFSSLSRVPERERDAWHARQTDRLVRLAMPCGTVIALLSPLVVTVLYDPRYEAAGVVLSILVARLMIRGFGQMRFQNLLASGRVWAATFAYIVAFTLQLAVIAPLVDSYGLVGLALSTLFSTLAVTIVQELITAWSRRREISSLAYTIGWAATGLACVAVIFE